MNTNFLAQMPPYKTKHERYQEQYPESIIIVKCRDKADMEAMNETSGLNFNIPASYPDKGAYTILGSDAIDMATVLKRTAEYHKNPNTGKMETFLSIANESFEGCLNKMLRKTDKKIVLVVQTIVLDMDNVSIITGVQTPTGIIPSGYIAEFFGDIPKGWKQFVKDGVEVPNVIEFIGFDTENDA